MKTDSAHFDAKELQCFGISLLTQGGLPSDRAQDVAEVLLEGDLLGHVTHGFSLLPKYLEELHGGGMSRDGNPQLVCDSGCSVLWDGNYLPGPWLVRRAIQLGCERLHSHPTFTLVIRRSHHIGCLQAYLQSVAESGILILLTCSDPASFVVAPFGGITPCYSPNPIAAGVPTSGDPILIDISTSSTSHGQCRLKAEAGQRLPGPWLQDQMGNPTNDPKVLFDKMGGSILPLGGEDLGYKGFALGLLVEALTSALGGHGRADRETRWGASVMLQMFNPAAFGGSEAFTRETSFLAEMCSQSPSPAGSPKVRLPGQAALKRRAGQLERGVKLQKGVVEGLAHWAEELEVPLPRPL